MAPQPGGAGTPVDRHPQRLDTAGQDGVTGAWVTEAGGLTSATKILAFGDMIGYIQDNNSGVPTLWAKQGRQGTWHDEYAPVNIAVFTG